MTRKLWMLGLMFTLVLNSFASAQVPRDWRRVDSLSAGSMLEIKLKKGSFIEGPMRRIGSDEIILVLNGADFTIAKSDVAEVRLTTRDSTKNGTLIGLGVGAGLGAAAGAAGDPGDLDKGAVTAASAAFYGAVGALVGWLVDRHHKSTLLYRAP